MGTPLKNPPVYLTLAQVRFNPILKMSEYLPEIQEKFRLAGYPDFERQQLLSFQVANQDGQPFGPTPVTIERYQFGNVEKTHVFNLDGHGLTLQCTDYGHFEKFSASFTVGLEILHDALHLDFVERIGLRYLDRVMPEAGETIEQYLDEKVHGLSSSLQGQPVSSYAETVKDIGNIRLISRVAIQDGELAFPPDLQIVNMNARTKFVTYTGISAILDNDGFIEKREVFSMENITKQLDVIHQVIGKAFRATVTAYALVMWDQ